EPEAVGRADHGVAGNIEDRALVDFDTPQIATPPLPRRSERPIDSRQHDLQALHLSSPPRPNSRDAAHRPRSATGAAKRHCTPKDRLRPRVAPAPGSARLVVPTRSTRR